MWSVSNTITGDNGANLIIGGKLADSVDGGAGDDVLLMLGGDDTINGGAGLDVFLSGAGADTMTGGADADTFLFDDEGADTITDFNIAENDLLLFFGAETSFAELSFSTDINGDAVIGYGTGSSVTMQGLTEAEINPTPGTAPGWILVA